MAAFCFTQNWAYRGHRTGVRYFVEPQHFVNFRTDRCRELHTCRGLGTPV